MHTKLGDRWNSIDPENIIQVPLNFEQESKLVTKALGKQKNFSMPLFLIQEFFNNESEKEY